jgi:hypothetical protein
MFFTNSTFSGVPKRVPIMKCHSDLACLKSSIVITQEHFSVSAMPRKKVFLCFTVHTVHFDFLCLIFIRL